MKRWLLGLVVVTLFPTLLAGAADATLKLEQTFAMPGVRGHFDHLAVDLRGHRLFVAAEDQPAVEVLDLRSGKRLKEMRDFKKPHAIFFFPKRDEIFVTDGGEGAVKIFRASDYRLMKTIRLQIDADSGYYDPASQHLFVVNGGSDAHQTYSFISVIDTHTRTDVKNIRIPNDHLEAIRLDGGNRLFANLTGSSEVGVVDLPSGRLAAQWSLDGPKANVPMAIDRRDHRLFVVTRMPGNLVVLNTRTGKVVASLNCSRDADDMVYDAADHLILVSCGEGFINVYRQIGPNSYQLAAKEPSAAGAKTAVWVPSLHRYYVAAPAHGAESARILVYRVR